MRRGRQFPWVLQGIIATPGYSVFIVPWMGSKANTNFDLRGQYSTSLGGGRLQTNPQAQNNLVNWDIWLDAGTYKFALIHSVGTDRGIFHVRLGGTDKGTIDSYSAVGNDNTYSEITGIAVTAGLYNFELKMATKNASSSNYVGQIVSAAWIRTGA